MSQPSFHDKRFRKNTKGMSGILATIFMVIIVLFLYANVFIYIQNENARFQGEAREANQMDVDLKNEQLTISNVSYTKIEDQIHVNLQVTNDGPLSVQIITLWVVDTTTQNYGYNDTLDIYLKIGETNNFFDSDDLIVTIENSSSSNIFTSWFVTERGNLIPLEGGMSPIVIAKVAMGIGALALDFDKFRYFTFESQDKLANYPNGTVGFNIPKGEYIAYGCYLTNYDLKKRAITIDAHSLLFQPGRSGVGEGTWYVVNVASDGTILSTSQGSYTPITFEYGVEKMLVFCSKFDLDLGNFDRLKTDNAVTTVATFLLMHGTIGSVPFGQNIPYVSLFYS